MRETAKGRTGRLWGLAIGLALLLLLLLWWSNLPAWYPPAASGAVSIPAGAGGDSDASRPGPGRPVDGQSISGSGRPDDWVAGDATLPSSGMEGRAAEASASLAGRVLDGSGRPVPLVAVELVPQAAGWMPAQYFSTLKAFTDDSGSYRFPGLVPGLYNVSCGGRPEGIRILPDRTTYRDFPLAASGVLAGSVQEPGGGPVYPAQVYLFGSNGRFVASVAPSGRFEIHGVSGGTWRLAARAGGYVPSGFTDLSLRDGEKREGIRLVLEPGSGVGGFVRYSSGRPAAGVYVATAPAAGRVGSQSALTDSRGYYELEGVAPGQVQLGVWVQGSHERGGYMTSVRPGEFTRFDIQIQEGGVIFGRVEGKGGEPVGSSVVVVLSPAENGPGRGRFFASARRAPDREGKYRFENVDPGDWLVQVASLAHWYNASPRRVSVTAGSREQADFVLQPVPHDPQGTGDVEENR